MLLSALAGPAAADPARQPSELMPLAVRSLILDVERIGQRLVAVGERGHILISDDGRSFRQVRAPVRSTLTALGSSPGGGSIFAVGHDGVVLKSTDRGLTWILVFSAPEQQRPLLDVVKLDERTILAVGAYGWLLRSEDGGATWSGRSIDADEPHLNAVAEAGDGALLVGAEFGIVYRSGDRGRTFRREDLPYGGSFFGVLRLNDAWLVFGLQGRVFRSADGVPGWQPVAAPETAALLTGRRLDDGHIVLAGAEGALLASAHGWRFELFRDPSRLAIAALEETDDGALLLAGESGLRLMSDVEDPDSIEPIPAPAR